MKGRIASNFIIFIALLWLMSCEQKAPEKKAIERKAPSLALVRDTTIYIGENKNWSGLYRAYRMRQSYAEGLGIQLSREKGVLLVNRKDTVERIYFPIVKWHHLDDYVWKEDNIYSLSRTKMFEGKNKGGSIMYFNKWDRQTESHQFKEIFRGNDIHTAYMIDLPSAGFAVVFNLNQKIIVLFLDADGKEQKRYESENIGIEGEGGLSILQLERMANAAIVLAVEVYSYDEQPTKIILKKLKDGELLWTKSFEGFTDRTCNYPSTQFYSTDSSFILLGKHYNALHLDADGELLAEYAGQLEACGDCYFLKEEKKKIYLFCKEDKQAYLVEVNQLGGARKWPVKGRFYNGFRLFENGEKGSWTLANRGDDSVRLIDYQWISVNDE